MLKVLIAESALELVPLELWSHPQVKKHAKMWGRKPSDLLLDTAYHYAAMKSLEERYRRGRPDILHITLLNLLESPPNKKGLLRIYFHTREGKVFEVDPETRIPRNYRRFVGLMVKVLKKNGTEFIRPANLEEILDENNIWVLHEGGKEPRRVPHNLLAIVGGFQSGDFRETWPGERISLAPFSLTTWSAVNELLCLFKSRSGLPL